VAVLIPCLNEAKSIAKVVREFREQLPHADIYVFDNCSTDGTTEAAAEAGAIVIAEPRRGKGNVVQSMFEQIDADLYIMVDGDDTYPAAMVSGLIAPVLKGDADMTIGSRIDARTNRGLRPLNYAGNLFFQGLINFIFGTHLTDILSGFRCMNRKLVKSLPLFVKGFEIEAEITIKSLERGFRLVEVPIVLRDRGEGSYSKIRIVRDGLRILTTIFALFRDYKPLTFFGSAGLLMILLGLIPGIRAVVGFIETGLVEYYPSAILSVGIIVTGILFIMVGLILHTINRRFQELEYFLRINNKTRL
jgi:glycosyltransferase involved in cell wall biosynthesis